MPDEIPPEVETMFNVAVGYFPTAQTPRNDSTRVLWGAQLWPRFTVDDVCYALARLAAFIGGDKDTKRRQRRETFPELSEVIEAADEERRKREAEATAKLHAPSQIRGSIAEQLAKFDSYATVPIGPYEARVREMIAAGVFQGGSSARDAMARLAPFTYQAAHGVLSRAMSETPPPVDPPERVKEIVDSWEAGSNIDVSEMSIALRAACREEVENRRRAKEASDGDTDSDRTLETSDEGSPTASASTGGGTGSDVD